MAKLTALGGVSGLAKAIGSHEHTGLDQGAKAGSPGSVEEHSRVFGPNKYKEVPSKNFFALCFENLKDPIILLLIAAALVRAARAAARRGSQRRVAYPPAMRERAPAAAAAGSHGCSSRLAPPDAPLAAPRQPASAAVAAAAPLQALSVHTRQHPLPLPAPRSPRCWAPRCLSSALRASGSRAWPSGSQC